jgi:hypothetical protein
MVGLRSPGKTNVDGNGLDGGGEQNFDIQLDDDAWLEFDPQPPLGYMRHSVQVLLFYSSRSYGTPFFRPAPDEG